MRLVWVCAIVAAVGCSKKPTEGGVRLKQVNDAFVSAGFKLDSFQPTDPGRFAAQKCVHGMLDGVDSMVCEYGSADAVTIGKKAGEDWVAQATTGAVLANGNTLLAVADRSRTDPNGKTIHKITQAYTKTR
jgi:hypothetical protein